MARKHSYITPLQIILMTMLRLASAVWVGVVIGLLCFLGQFFMNSVFGLFLVIKPWNALMAGMGWMVPASIIAATLITAWWTDTFDLKSFLNLQNNALYGLVGWALPMGAFAFSLYTGMLGVNAAYWLAFGLATVTNSVWLVVVPALKDLELLGRQKKLPPVPSQPQVAPQVNPPQPIQMPAQLFEASRHYLNSFWTSVRRVVYPPSPAPAPAPVPEHQPPQP